MSMWRPLFLKCMILDHKLQRMLNDSKIAQLNSERPLHQTVVTLNPHFGRKYFNPGLFLQLSHILNLACMKSREQGGAGILQTKAQEILMIYYRIPTRLLLLFLLTYVQKTDILIFLLHEIFFSLLLRFASLLNQKFKIGFLHFLLHYPFPSWLGNEFCSSVIISPFSPFFLSQTKKFSSPIKIERKLSNSAEKSLWILFNLNKAA